MVVIVPEPDSADIANTPLADNFKNSCESSVTPSDNHPEAASCTDNGQDDDDSSYEDALDDEQLEERARRQANDAKAKGNELFGAGMYKEALSQYETALQTSPDGASSVELRSICHANRAACFLKLKNYDDTIKECKKALEFNPSYVKALSRRAEAHEKLEQYEEAVSDLKKVIELDPSNAQAIRSLRHLEPLAAEKREKMKEEMIGKLKEMGNNILGRFGMSVDNFKAVKDPNTGSYSISFQR